MHLSKKIIFLTSSILLSLGILGAGLSVGNGMYLARKFNRILTVKGLAEQDIQSDLAIWDINYREIGNDLIALDQKLQHDQEIVINFLKQQGFTIAEFNPLQLKVEDRFANVYNQTTQDQSAVRYVVTGGVRIRSSNVNSVQSSVQMTDKLLQQGIPLAFDVSSLSPNPSYYFTKLDDIRPAMLTAATKSAQAVAKQFAKDLNSRIGRVERANQGVFQIMSRDTSTMSSDWNSNANMLGSIEKRIRLVTTIDYRLK